MSLEFDQDHSQYLTVEEVASLLKISSKTIYSWCSKGYLPCVKFGHLIRIKKANLKARLDEIEQQSVQKGT
jgi:excisionase family DNA binding protein